MNRSVVPIPPGAPAWWPRAVDELAAADPVLRRLCPSAGALDPGARGDAFTTLARSIVGQQVSVKAAQAIWSRFAHAVPAVTPQHVCALDAAAMRACGLSSQKSQYLADLARRFADGALQPEGWAALDDEALIAELERVKGIGRWTAQMFLIFFLARPDVLPLDDVGLQRAMSLHYNHGQPLSKLKMRAIAEAWAPWRTVATWTLWRSLDPDPPIAA
jgi:DNA-3-methyladenine glycosylase II